MTSLPLNKISKHVFSHPKTRAFLSEQFPDSFDQIEERLKQPPRHTVLRVQNTNVDPETALVKVQRHLEQTNQPKSNFQVALHPQLKQLVVIESQRVSPGPLEPVGKEIVVDCFCGCAVLRGAHVFAIGVMGAPTHLQPGDGVAVYADVARKCLKGFAQDYQEDKQFVGNGIALMSRQDIFKGSDKPSGVAIQITETLSMCPSMNELEQSGEFTLQNLPSVLSVATLDPEPGDFVLDMCAAPGGKTMHLADLVGPSGCVWALDRSEGKRAQILKNATRLTVDNVRAFVMDGRTILSEVVDDRPLTRLSEPPFPPGSFGKILLDAPCSGLGQRPQLTNAIRLSELRSYPKLQKQLFHSAQGLLRTGGCLVYSTCTFNPAENEAIVAWACQTFPDLELVPTTPRLGRSGLPGQGLDAADCDKVQRFDMLDNSTCESDTIGFFVAKFRKRH